METRGRSRNVSRMAEARKASEERLVNIRGRRQPAGRINTVAQSPSAASKAANNVENPTARQRPGFAPVAEIVPTTNTASGACHVEPWPDLSDSLSL